MIPNFRETIRFAPPPRHVPIWLLSCIISLWPTPPGPPPPPPARTDLVIVVHHQLAHLDPRVHEACAAHAALDKVHARVEVDVLVQANLQAVVPLLVLHVGWAGGAGGGDS